MQTRDNEKWLDEALAKVIGSKKHPGSFDQWKADHPEAVKILKSRATDKVRHPRPLDIRRMIMRSSITKLAAAAVIIIAITLGIYLITGRTPSVTCCAWAKIADKIEQIKTCIYRVSATQMAGLQPQAGQQVEAQMYISSDYGLRMDTYIDGNFAMHMYTSIDDMVMIGVIPVEKKYMRIKLTEEQLAEMKGQDPREMASGFMSGQFTELGRDTIDGIEVAGIEVNNPPMFEGIYSNFVGRLWVDVETEYPMRMEIEADISTGEQSAHMSLVMDGFEWGVQLGPELFEPNIPEDYEMIAEVKMPEQNEQGAIEGLRLFAEMTEGKYPSQMNMMTTMQEAQQALRKTLDLAPGTQPTQEQIQQITAKAITLQGPFLFYNKLAQEGKEPAYYGDKVTTKFGESVLMRWKVSDGNYRVIFGDLTTADVTAGELAELEAMPLNRQPKAIKPQPANGSIAGKIVDLKLSWMPGMFVTEHKVYFGTEKDNLPLLEQVSDQSNTASPELMRNTTYYWRVDEIGDDGSVTTGDIWSFNTGSMLGWWKLDESNGTIAADNSGNGNDGTLQGNPTWETSGGMVDGALWLNGNDYVKIENESAFDITEQITVATWIQVDAFDKDWQAIITKGDSAWRLSRGPGNVLHFACSGTRPQTPWVNGQKDVNDATWHHVVGTYDGTEMRLYVDGLLDASTPAAGSIATNDYPVLIGENAQLKGRQWNGLIDDVRIYNYHLSENEVTELYNNSYPDAKETQ